MKNTVDKRGGNRKVSIKTEKNNNNKCINIDDLTNIFNHAICYFAGSVILLNYRCTWHNDRKHDTHIT